MTQRPSQRGYILLPVVLALTLVAVAAYLINRDSAMDANIAAGQKQADEARYVAEAGFNHMLWKLRHGNGTYQNMPTTAFGAHSYSATVTPLTGSPVTIVATATMANGATRTLRRDNVTVVACNAPKTIILQPGAEGIDATLNQQQETRNYGGDGNLLVASGASGGGGSMGGGSMGGGSMGGGGGTGSNANALLKFDLSAIPAGATVSSAILNLYLENLSSSTMQVSLYRVTRSWVEGTRSGTGTADGTTWKTYNGSSSWGTDGGDHDATATALTTVNGTPGWYSWDTTALVTGWLTTPASDNGMLLAGPSGGGSGITATFTSSDATGSAAGHKPQLSVTYTGPCN